MAIHSGTAESREGDFFGQALNRDARILAIGHGGQILLSAVAAALARALLPAGVELRDLGRIGCATSTDPSRSSRLPSPTSPRPFRPLRSLTSRRSNLPLPLTSFVGREREVAEVERLIEQGRLVTLIGTGGTGKTRLMIEVAGRVVPRFEDGVWLAELAALGDAGEIGPEIGRALGVSALPGRDPLEHVVEFLMSKELLLVLDNAEHLIDGVARVAERVLAAAPGVRILDHEPRGAGGRRRGGRPGHVPDLPGADRRVAATRGRVPGRRGRHRGGPPVRRPCRGGPARRSRSPT